MSVSPDKDSEGLVTFTVYSNGTAMTDQFGVVSIMIRKEVNRIGKALIVFTAGDMPRQEIPESDSDAFVPGTEVKIAAGYNSVENVIFEGIVTSHNLEIPEDGEVTLNIECRDYAFPGTLSRKNKIFENSKDSDAISTIMKTYSPLSVTADATTTEHPALVQYYCSDWDFVVSRADANGLVVITEGKKITVAKPAVTAAAVLKVTYGADLISFSGALLSADQPADTEAVSWDMATQKIITAAASKPTLNEQGNINASKLAEASGSNKYILQSDSSAGESFLKSWADAQMLKAGLSRIRGEIRFQGSSLAVVGCIVELDGLGERFNGNAYAGMVEHDISEGEWITTVGMGISPENATDNTDVAAPPAAGLLPGIAGMHIGKVVKVNDDPETQNKIQVEIPLLNGDKNNVWARLSNFWASSGYGAFFIPDVGDEVVLGFFNNDPCHAVILGSLYSSKQAPPYSLTQDNDIRAIVTKSKLKLEFNETKKVITLLTPGNNSIEISDEGKSIKITDQHSNKIEMTASGISIESAGELALKAKTNITLDAGANAEITAKATASIAGANVEATAKAAFTAKGNAKAELSASGQTVIKGAMVMIN